MHDIEADPTSRNLRDRLSGRKPRKKQKFHQLDFRQGRRDVGRGQLGVDDLLAQTLQLHAPAIVRDGNGQHAPLMRGFEAYDACLGFADSPALFWRFNAMIDGIAQQVAERRLEALKDITVYLSGTPNDLKIDLFPQPPSDVAHH